MAFLIGTEHDIGAIPGGGYSNIYRGPATVNVQFSRRSPYIADVFHKASYHQSRDFLAETAEKLIVEAGLYSPDTAKKMVTIGMEATSDQNASMILFRFGRQYIGLSWQEMRVIPTTEGNIPLMYLRLRVFKEGHRRIGLGKVSMQLGRNTHSESEPMYCAARTESAAAADSYIYSGLFRSGEISPWEELFDDPTHDSKLLKQQLLLTTHFLVRINGKGIDMSTGVSKDDYPESNMAYVPDQPILEPWRLVEE